MELAENCRSEGTRNRAGLRFGCTIVFYHSGRMGLIREGDPTHLEGDYAGVEALAALITGCVRPWDREIRASESSVLVLALLLERSVPGIPDGMVQA